jgi:hypothetical protein
MLERLSAARMVDSRADSKVASWVNLGAGTTAAQSVVQRGMTLVDWKAVDLVDQMAVLSGA